MEISAYITANLPDTDASMVGKRDHEEVFPEDCEDIYASKRKVKDYEEIPVPDEEATQPEDVWEVRPSEHMFGRSWGRRQSAVGDVRLVQATGGWATTPGL